MQASKESCSRTRFILQCRNQAIAPTTAPLPASALGVGGIRWHRHHGTWRAALAGVALVGPVVPGSGGGRIADRPRLVLHHVCVCASQPASAHGSATSTSGGLMDAGAGARARLAHAPAPCRHVSVPKTDFCPRKAAEAARSNIDKSWTGSFLCSIISPCLLHGRLSTPSIVLSP